MADTHFLTTREISIAGKWIAVPVFSCGNDELVISGKLVRVAAPYDEAWSESDLADPAQGIQELRSHADILTFTQPPPFWFPFYEQYYYETESIAAVLLTTYEDWWAGVPQETRKNVRRAERDGVTVCIRQFDDNLVRELQELNNSSTTRQGRYYLHFGKTFEQVRRDYASYAERSLYLTAHHEGETIGYIKIVYRGNDLASIMNLLTKESANRLRPANALLAKAIRICTTRGIDTLTYGRFNYGKRRNTPLSQFKARHGFEDIQMPRYYVPLTWKGLIWVQLGLHRGLLGIVPDGLVRVGKSLKAGVAQLAERLIRNQEVGGSIPSTGSTHLG